MSGRRLSVALPVRNGAKYLGAALDSILAQSYREFDLFVSDNASTDETAEILTGYAARDPRVKVSRSAELIAQPANMNRAMALTDTPWVKLFCHDDLMLPDCLARIMAAIECVAGSNVALIGNGERHLFGDRLMTDATGLEHRAKKWAPVFGVKRCDNKDYEHRAKKWAPVFGVKRCDNKDLQRAADPPVAPSAPTELLIIPGHEAIARKLWNVALAVPFPAVTTATVRKDAFLAIGGFDDRYVYFDIFCWLEMLMRHDYAVDRRALTVNRIHGGQVAQQGRRSLREVRDFREFLRGFAARHGTALAMSRKARLRLKLIPVALASRAVAIQLRARRPGDAAAMAWQLPVHYWPLLPVLVPRAVVHERRNTRRHAAHVPIDLLYPA